MNASAALPDEVGRTYARILVAVDSSPLSDAATAEAVRIACLCGSQVTAIHAYAAKLHDTRFRQMEGSLPAQFQAETELDRQRRVHDKLITRGLEMISDSYLDLAARSCAQAGVPFTARAVEGKNYRSIVDELRAGGHDLLVLGSAGLGAVRPGVLGTVCARVVRRTPVDTLVVKSPRPIGDGPIVVAVDGSPHAYGGLITGLELGSGLDVPVQVVAAYDPHFHTVAFRRIGGVLSERAGKVFRFEEQHQLHNEIIDAGLAKVYQSHLAISATVAADRGAPIETTLLAGKPFDAILAHAERVKASLLIVGKIGIHADDQLDIGGTTEQLLGLADCNVLISCRTHAPAHDLVARETVSWTQEAEARLARAPSFVRTMARTAILRFALEQGHTVITTSVVDRAMEHLMPHSGGPS